MYYFSLVCRSTDKNYSLKFFACFFSRTPNIRWEYVVKNGLQVVLCVFFTYFVFARFCVPVFRNTGKEQGNLR